MACSCFFSKQTQCCHTSVLTMWGWFKNTVVHRFVRVRLKIPTLPFSIFMLHVTDRCRQCRCSVIMIVTGPLLQPLVDDRVVHLCSSDITGTTILQPITPYRSNMIRTLATLFRFRKSNIHPSIAGMDRRTFLRHVFLNSIAYLVPLAVFVVVPGPR